MNGFHSLTFPESMLCVGVSPLYEEKLAVNSSRNTKIKTGSGKAATVREHLSDHIQPIGPMSVSSGTVDF